jgi:hypothetical protein
MPFFKTPSYMEKARTMENKSYGWDLKPSQPSSTTTSSSSSSKPPSNDSSETLVATTTSDSTSSASADHKEPLSTVERIKLEREYEKANPKKPLKPAEGIWKSKWMIVPAALLYGFGGGGC